MYELTTGDVPFMADTPLALLMSARVNAPVPPQKRNPQIPSALNALILQLLAKQPADRPSTDEVVERIEGIALEMGVPLHPMPGKPGIPWKPPAQSRRKFLLGAIGVVGAAGAGLLARHFFFSEDSEILLGMTGPFSGSSRELGRDMNVGIETCLKNLNDQGGIGGRKIKLVALDDGYEPDKALANMKELNEQRKVFAVIGNIGTPTAAKTVPYAKEHKLLFFGGFTGAQLLREDPPSRYIFNYRASYKEETSAIVKYLLDHYRLRPERLAVFAQNDGYGDDGFQGVAATLQKYGRDAKDIVRVGYERNTMDIKAAVQTILAHPEIRAVVMVAVYNPAAEFIRKIKDAGRDIIFTNVSFVGSLALAEELRESGPNYAEGVIVTQVVPPIDSGASLVLKYRELLKQYFPAERPTFTSAGRLHRCRDPGGRNQEGGEQSDAGKGDRCPGNDPELRFGDRLTHHVSSLGTPSLA